jgi:hypothetical protein
MARLHRSTSSKQKSRPSKVDIQIFPSFRYGLNNATMRGISSDSSFSKSAISSTTLPLAGLSLSIPFNLILLAWRLIPFLRSSSRYLLTSSPNKNTASAVPTFNSVMSCTLTAPSTIKCPRNLLPASNTLKRLSYKSRFNFATAIRACLNAIQDPRHEITIRAIACAHCIHHGIVYATVITGSAISLPHISAHHLARQAPLTRNTPSLPPRLLSPLLSSSYTTAIRD